MIAFIAAFALTMAAIIIPEWITFDQKTNTGTRVHYSYGLYTRCSSLDGKCSKFPSDAECHGENRYFCSMWRSVGFLMSLGVVFEGMTIVAFLVLLLGGKQKRESGWSVLALLILVAAIVQCAAISLVAYLHDNDERFFMGWELATSWILATVSWCLQAFCAAAVTAAALILPSEGGYELIPDHI